MIKRFSYPMQFLILVSSYLIGWYIWNKELDWGNVFVAVFTSGMLLLSDYSWKEYTKKEHN